jgi:hypothetical protein
MNDVFTPQLPDLHLSVRAVIGGGSEPIGPPADHASQRIKRLQAKSVATLPPLPNVAGNAFVIMTRNCRYKERGK